MTLIVASILQHEIVLTADSRSTTRHNGIVTHVNDQFQKLFPIPDHPVVIAHLGLNEFDREPVSQLIQRFVDGLNTGNFTITEIADQLRQFVHPTVRTCLKNVRDPKIGVNFWVAGYSFHEKGPRLVENFWQFKDDVLMMQESALVPTSVVEGGDGKEVTDKGDWRRVAEQSLDGVTTYNESLMDQAMRAKIEDNSVGGSVQEIVITPAEWLWTRPPPQGR